MNRKKCLNPLGGELENSVGTLQMLRSDLQSFCLKSFNGMGPNEDLEYQEQGCQDACLPRSCTKTSTSLHVPRVTNDMALNIHGALVGQVPWLCFRSESYDLVRLWEVCRQSGHCGMNGTFLRNGKVAVGCSPLCLKAVWSGLVTLEAEPAELAIQKPNWVSLFWWHVLRGSILRELHGACICEAGLPPFLSGCIWRCCFFGNADQLSNVRSERDPVVPRSSCAFNGAIYVPEKQENARLLMRRVAELKLRWVLPSYKRPCFNSCQLLSPILQGCKNQEGALHEVVPVGQWSRGTFPWWKQHGFQFRPFPLGCTEPGACCRWFPCLLSGQAFHRSCLLFSWLLRWSRIAAACWKRSGTGSPSILLCPWKMCWDLTKAQDWARSRRLHQSCQVSRTNTGPRSHLATCPRSGLGPSLRSNDETILLAWSWPL